MKAGGWCPSADSPRRLENKEWNATPATNVTLRVFNGFVLREQDLAWLGATIAR